MMVTEALAKSFPCKVILAPFLLANTNSRKREESEWRGSRVSRQMRRRPPVPDLIEPW